MKKNDLNLTYLNFIDGAECLILLRKYFKVDKKEINGILTILLALIVQISFSQEKTISGTVCDTSGMLPGSGLFI